METQRIKRERAEEFSMQKALEQEYLKIQPVSKSGSDAGGPGG